MCRVVQGVMKLLLSVIVMLLVSAGVQAQSESTTEVRSRLVQPSGSAATAVAITLDACGGAYDADMISMLIAMRIPATVFVTKMWLDRNPGGTVTLLAYSDLFDLEDHGTAHVPAVIGAGSSVYGLAGAPDLAHLEAEVSGGAEAIRSLTGHAPRYYRGATAIYDQQSIQAIEALGYRIAGFSVNADDGATLSQEVIVARLRKVRAGDVVIAHMNKPDGETAEAFAIVLPELQARGYRFVKLSQANLKRIQDPARN
jgi:peptidoglycan/xylan/chitin deacetylase (PgdA/CDA1 family)